MKNKIQEIQELRRELEKEKAITMQKVRELKELRQEKKEVTRLKTEIRKLRKPLFMQKGSKFRKDVNKTLKVFRKNLVDVGTISQKVFVRVGNGVSEFERQEIKY